MMSLKIIIDSTAGYSPEELEQLDLTAVPLAITMDGREYQDGVDLSPQEFYQKLAYTKSTPVTGKVDSLIFEHLFSFRLEEADEVVAILLSGSLSGTCEAAREARERLVGPERIHIVDTGSVSMGSMVLINEAVRLRHLGVSGEEMARTLKSLKGRLRMLAVTGSRKYLRRSGKLTGGSEMLDKLFSRKPVVRLTQGTLSVESQPRGEEAACQWIAAAMAREGVDPAFPPVLGSAQAPELTSRLAGYLEKVPGVGACGRCEIGPAIGSYIGPGSAGVAWIVPEKQGNG